MDRVGIPDRYRKHPQRIWSVKTLYYDETILTLNAALNTAVQSFDHLQYVFEEEIKTFGWCVKEGILDSL